MPRTRHLQTNFTSGELSPRLFGRVDLEQYGNGAAELLNFQVMAQGGATRRPGTAFAGKVKTATSRARMVPFIVSNLTAYVLEFGHLYLRFWRNRGQVQGGVLVPLELVTPWTLDMLRDLRFAASADVLYITSGGSIPPHKLTRTAANAFTLAPVAFVDGPYMAENTGNVGATGTGGYTTAPDAGTTTPSPPTGSGTSVPPDRDSGSDSAGGNSG